MIDLYSVDTWQACLEDNQTDDTTFSEYETETPIEGAKPRMKKYCLSFKYGDKVLGILPFVLEPGESLTEWQVDLFENIGDDIAIALKSGQERHAFYEMRTSEAALAERREVSHYLHDHLGQSLGYLHIKMDQLIIERDKLTLDKVYDDLSKMREAVNDSYEIVRGILETIHEETAPSLTNLLMEHARKVSQRSNLEIDFKSKGNPVPLPTEVQRAVFYAFEESSVMRKNTPRQVRLMYWPSGEETTLGSRSPMMGSVSILNRLIPISTLEWKSLMNAWRKSMGISP